MNAMMRDAERCNALLKAQSQDGGPTLEDVYRAVMAMNGEIARLKGQVAVLEALLRSSGEQETVSDRARLPIQRLPVVAAVQEAAGAHGVKETDILSKSRLRHIAWARFHSWRILHVSGRSFPWIARQFGAHHTSVMYGVRQWEAHGESYLRYGLGLSQHPPYRGVSEPPVAEHEKGNPERFSEPRGVSSQQVPVAPAAGTQGGQPMTYVTAQFGKRVLPPPIQGEKKRWTLADMMADARRCNLLLTRTRDGAGATSLGRKDPNYGAMRAMAIAALAKGPITAPELAAIARSSTAAANKTFRRLEAVGMAKLLGKAKPGARAVNLWGRVETEGGK